MQIDIDSIDNSTFWVVDNFVKDSLPGNKKSSVARKTVAVSSTAKVTGAPFASAGSPADGPSKPKKLRT
jgi:hypothetical protein